jgi:cytochrome c-type biogenesis protein CcmH
VRRWGGWIAIGWLVLVCAIALAAYGQPAHSVSLDARTRAVAAQLRCLVCQGESVADSPSDFARSVRALIRQRLRQGQSAGQIESFLVSRYGDRILMAPPAHGIGDVAWLAPPLLVLGGIGLLLTLVADWRRHGREPSNVRDEYLQRVRAELAAGE